MLTRHRRRRARADRAPACSAALTAASDDPALKGGTGISVRDGITGEELWALRRRDPAGARLDRRSCSAALAVADGLDLDATG